MPSCSQLCKQTKVNAVLSGYLPFPLHFCSLRIQRSRNKQTVYIISPKGKIPNSHYYPQAPKKVYRVAYAGSLHWNARINIYLYCIGHKTLT